MEAIKPNYKEAIAQNNVVTEAVTFLANSNLL